MCFVVPSVMSFFVVTEVVTGVGGGSGLYCFDSIFIGAVSVGE